VQSYLQMLQRNFPKKACNLRKPSPRASTWPKHKQPRSREQAAEASAAGAAAEAAAAAERAERQRLADEVARLRVRRHSLRFFYMQMCKLLPSEYHIEQMAAMGMHV